MHRGLEIGSLPIRLVIIPAASPARPLHFLTEVRYSRYLTLVPYLLLEILVTDGLPLRENSDYIQAIGLSSANSNTYLTIPHTKVLYGVVPNPVVEPTEGTDTTYAQVLNNADHQVVEARSSLISSIL